MKYLTMLAAAVLITSCDKFAETDSYSDSFMVNDINTCLMRAMTEYQHCRYATENIEHTKLCLIAYNKMSDDCKQIYSGVKSNG